jgi:hypothetical protein
MGDEPLCPCERTRSPAFASMHDTLYTMIHTTVPYHTLHYTYDTPAPARQGHSFGQLSITDLPTHYHTRYTRSCYSRRLKRERAKCTIHMCLTKCNAFERFRHRSRRSVRDMTKRNNHIHVIINMGRYTHHLYYIFTFCMIVCEHGLFQLYAVWIRSSSNRRILSP